MDEIIPGLWIGDLASALDVEELKSHSIFSILSAMRGRVTIHETFIRHQIKLDDTEDEDILTHFLPSINFIQEELDKGRGVLVHCQAGISRSSTIVAAYLMYSQKIDPNAALALIKQKRPNVEPNQGFLYQLELFHTARYKISRREKSVRRFYMERTVGEVMNGDGSLPETGMFARYPSDSVPATPSETSAPAFPIPRRRIRCKKCRQELATREHMLDHGQLGPATPAIGTPASVSPAVSRRPSGSSGQGSLRPLIRPSISSGLTDSLAMSSIQEHPSTEQKLDLSSSQQESNSTSASTFALETEEDADEPTAVGSPLSLKVNADGTAAADISIHKSEILGRQLSDAVISTIDDRNAHLSRRNSHHKVPSDAAVVESPMELPDTTIEQPSRLISPSDLSAQLFSNPKLAGLRSPTLPSQSTLSNNSVKGSTPVSAPILVNPQCSGYFVEPMGWMEHFLEGGQLAGKITCPNKKCGAKLGNYDWAGVCCGCKEWVTPGFCINRSKVDEVL
ncbi:Dual specificity protein phosphatase MPK-4 [Psilocybe cubensis]|uniref:Dual specificity protein phosphatase MPK-4 n=2 Tax=Psilocybe cubensis TaxID=181762 RepID=A0ACB8GS31_PSICU|nr:Dual specificity protein phosphatase MPK-4 [Psilocybe cubensis]KAH9478381.1 Dual specificity protein phosphatase MPK-4 [Psilocybe cubensis]